MKAETLFDNFEVLADAPNGVQKLRELILQLAVRGKLVEQDEKDEPAAVLVEKIKTERERLIKEKKIKKKETLAESELEEKPFNLPNGWEWIRIGEIAELIRGVSYRKQDASECPLSGYLPVLRANNINGKINFDELVYVPASNISKVQFIRAGDILIAMSSGSKHLVGKAAQLESDFNGGFGAFCGLIRLTSIIYKRYISYFFKSPYYRQTVASSGKGIGINNLQKQYVEQIIVPLPPLEEQYRIVAKVDQLMSLCDELEARQQKKRESRTHLNSAALDRLLAARAPGEFAKGWRRISDNFDLLYDTPENVGKLRRIILELAVRGKLVMREPNEETASALLNKIKIEKERLIKEKRIKKIESFPPIEIDEIPYELHKKWEWVRLGDLIESMTNGIYKPAKYYADNGIGCLRMYNISDGKINLLNLKRILLDEGELEQYQLIQGDLLVNRVNSRELVGKAGVINPNKEPLIFESKNIRVRFIISNILPKYINILFQTVEVRKVFEGTAKQTCGQASISQPQIANIVTPLPPLEEQARIVARVDHLMSMCDELEAGLLRSLADGERLMEAVVGRMLAEE